MYRTGPPQRNVLTEQFAQIEEKIRILTAHRTVDRQDRQVRQADCLSPLDLGDSDSGAIIGVHSPSQNSIEGPSKVRRRLPTPPVADVRPATYSFTPGPSRSNGSKSVLQGDGVVKSGSDTLQTAADGMGPLPTTVELRSRRLASPVRNRRRQ